MKDEKKTMSSTDQTNLLLQLIYEILTKDIIAINSQFETGGIGAVTEAIDGQHDIIEIVMNTVEDQLMRTIMGMIFYYVRT